MTDNDPLTSGFITDVLDITERHGYHRGDTDHTGQAIGLIGDLARIYQGTLDAPRGGSIVVPSSWPAGPQPPGQPAVIVSPGQAKTLLAALGDAATATGPEHAPTAPTGPAPPASGGCRQPEPTTSWLSR